MTKKLIIVESPTKARTIGGILGKDFDVVSSVGHIRDLPRTRFGVKVQDNFSPEYVTISGKQKVIEKIKKSAKNAEIIYLAADPDREGEAICWHLVHYLQSLQRPIHRILYHEITPQAITRSLESATDIDLDKVNAQQARRVLDRIVGYRLSPLLWKKVRGGLSAGRVQSVALRLICDREREIQAFIPEEYWTIDALLNAGGDGTFSAAYYGSHGKKTALNRESDAVSVVDDCRSRPFVIQEVKKRKVSRSAPPPFITSTLQQEAARRFRFPAGKTMRVAQSLYEGKQFKGGQQHGLITYMRTDSPRVSTDAEKAARDYIGRHFGEELVPAKPPTFKAGKRAQEAHEAIRPTHIDLTPQEAANYLSGDDLRLYNLIWTRFIASQMKPARLNVTTAHINAGTDGQHQFRASGTEILFKGFWELTGVPGQQDNDEGSGDSSTTGQSQVLPILNAGQTLDCQGLKPAQHFTKPPARFSEASLVKELETRGIGRPSTYATIMSTIRQHDYVEIKDRKFFPTELGFVVTDLLCEFFPSVMSVEFTAHLEDQLDDIESRKALWTDVVKDFYVPFAELLKTAEKKSTRVKTASEPVPGVECPVCGGEMIKRFGKKGAFLSCAKFPDCKGSMPLSSEGKPLPPQKAVKYPTGAPCPDCGAPMMLRTGRYGLFLSCSQFPKCRGKGPKPDGLPCPKPECSGTLALKRGKNRKKFYGCNQYPECTFIFSGVAVPEPCPACQHPYQAASVKDNQVVMKCPQCEHATVVKEEQSD